MPRYREVLRFLATFWPRSNCVFLEIKQNLWETCVRSTKLGKILRGQGFLEWAVMYITAVYLSKSCVGEQFNVGNINIMSLQEIRCVVLRSWVHVFFFFFLYGFSCSAIWGPGIEHIEFSSQSSATSTHILRHTQAVTEQICETLSLTLQLLAGLMQRRTG